MEKFSEYLKILDALDHIGSFVVENHFNWVKEFQMPNMELDLPCVKKTAKIQILQYKKTPIFMQLSDGSQLFFTLDEFRRIKGKPEVGKTVNYEMLRLADDKSSAPSMLKSCIIV